MLVELIVAVADATEEKDLLAGFKWASESKYNRRIVGAALVGSAAVGDTRIGLYYGTQKIGQIVNNNTGLTLDFSSDLRTHSSQLVCPPAEALQAIVEDPPATNPIKLFLDVQESQ